MKVATVLCVLMVFAAGCATERSVPKREKSKEFSVYLESCRDILQEVGEEGAIPASATTEEFSSRYEIVYADSRYVSYRAEEYWYCGGAHGSTTVTVLTIDRKTGREMTLEDFIPKEKHAALQRALRTGAIQKLGSEERLLDEVNVIDNFYVAADGLHFIYNQYEIAAYAYGQIEVVIQPDKL